MSWKEVFAKGEEIVLVTYSVESGPHANVVISRGYAGDDILINDCQMSTTIENLQKSSEACLIGKKDKEYYRLKGKVGVYSEGEYFDTAKEREVDYDVKNAIVFKIDNIFDLDKVEAVGK